MTVLNVVACVILFAAVAVFATPADSVPNENEWLITAQESIKDSLSNLKSYGADTDKIKEIANEAFDAFTMFVRNGLSDIIKQTDDMEPEEISELRARLVNWSDALLRLNRVDGAGEKLADKALGKFRITIDYVSKEVIEFVKNYDFESEKSKRIGKEIEALTKESVIKLAEYAKSVEDQVSGFFKN